MVDAFVSWLAWAKEAAASNETLLWALGGLSVATLVVSAIVLPLVVVRIPANYYARPANQGRSDKPAFVRWGIAIVRNVLGVTLILAGIAMLALPGQGLLTILAGLACVSVPGKRRFEIRILRAPGVIHAVRWLREKAGVRPLELP